MRQPTLSGIVQRRFLHCVNGRGQTVQEVVASVGIAPGDLCRVIANQDKSGLSLNTCAHVALWLRMPLANVIALAEVRPKLPDLIRLGMQARGYHVRSAQDQIAAAAEAEISVAVFRRALHGYGDFSPSIRTCDRLAAWLAWTGLEPDDIVTAAGMVMHYRPDGTRIALTPAAERAIRPYPCACGRAGCMVPAHIPSGPRRIWRSDACRMWAKRREQRDANNERPRAAVPHSASIVRFIVINERSVPARF
jgi:hypothetical protein